jgi:hypothetical protein
MRVEVVAQQGVVAGGITFGVGGQPALGGVDLAILLGLPVLRRDELRAQRHDLRMAGTDDDRRDGAVEMRGLAVGVAEAGTVGAMDVLGWGGKIEFSRYIARLGRHPAHATTCRSPAVTRRLPDAGYRFDFFPNQKITARLSGEVAVKYQGRTRQGAETPVKNQADCADLAWAVSVLSAK